MRSSVLIAGNYLREQRWLVLVLLAWVLGSSLVLGLSGRLGGNPMLEDAAFFLHQQAVYGVAFATFLAASSIQNERRSRRILSVLSKGIERREYLAGLLLGIGAVEAIYAFAMALGAFWMLRESVVASSAIGWLLLVLFLAAMLAAAVALFFATFLSPLFALAATAITASIPAAVALTFAPGIAIVPIYPLITYVMNASVTVSRAPAPALLGVSAAQVFGFWLAAAWIFGRRDIAAAIE
jgi:hypothetical protein